MQLKVLCLFWLSLFLAQHSCPLVKKKTKTMVVEQNVLVVVNHLVLVIAMVVAPTIAMDFAVVTAGLTVSQNTSRNLQ